MRGYPVFVWTVALVFSLISLGAVLDEPAVEWSFGALAWVLVPTLMASRSLRYSVRVTDEEVTVRNFIRTHRIPLQDVVAIEPVNYSGLWNRFSESSVFSTVRISTHEREVLATCLVGRAATARSAAVRLRQYVGLPPGAAGANATGQHRAAHRRQ